MKNVPLTGGRVHHGAFFPAKLAFGLFMVTPRNATECNTFARHMRQNATECNTFARHMRQNATECNTFARHMRQNATECNTFARHMRQNATECNVPRRGKGAHAILSALGSCCARPLLGLSCACLTRSGMQASRRIPEQAGRLRSQPNSNRAH